MGKVDSNDRVYDPVIRFSFGFNLSSSHAAAQSILINVFLGLVQFLKSGDLSSSVPLKI